MIDQLLQDGKRWRKPKSPKVRKGTKKGYRISIAESVDHFGYEYSYQ